MILSAYIRRLLKLKIHDVVQEVSVGTVAIVEGEEESCARTSVGAYCLVVGDHFAQEVQFLLPLEEIEQTRPVPVNGVRFQVCGEGVGP